MDLDSLIAALSSIRDARRVGHVQVWTGMESRPRGWIQEVIVDDHENRGHPVVVILGQESVGEQDSS